MNWTKMTEPPYEGYTGVVLITGIDGNSLPQDEYWYDIGTYCDGTWYKLDYDDRLGVLRKVPIKGDIAAYAQYLVPKL